MQRTRGAWGSVTRGRGKARRCRRRCGRSGQDDHGPSLIPVVFRERCWDPCVQGRLTPQPAAEGECEAGPWPPALTRSLLFPRWRSGSGGVREAAAEVPLQAQTLGSQVPMAQLVSAAGLRAALFELKSRRGHS